VTTRPRTRSAVTSVITILYRCYVTYNLHAETYVDAHVDFCMRIQRIHMARIEVNVDGTVCVCTLTVLTKTTKLFLY